MKFYHKYAGQRFLQRILIMLFAVILMGCGTSLCLLSNMGSDPFSTMGSGIAPKLGLSFGTWIALINIILLVLVAIFDRSLIGIGSIGNMFICGFSADFFKTVWAHFFDLTNLTIPIRLLLVVVGSCILIFGCSLYMTSNLGMGPYDCIAFIIINRFPNRNLKYRWVRMTHDAIAFLIGVFFGAAFGLGTLIMVFATGPLIPLCNKYISAKIVGLDKIKQIDVGT